MTKQSFSIKSYVNKHLRNHLKKTKTQKDLANTACKVSSHEKRRLPTLPRVCSTIGADGLNFSVRNGKRWIPRAVIALISFLPTETLYSLSPLYQKNTHTRKLITSLNQV